MRKKPTPAFLVFAFVVLAAALVLVTSGSSLSQNRVNEGPSAARAQQVTPTPTDEDRSVAGSTDGIVWMGIVIALIVISPMLANRAIWAERP